MPTVEIRHTWAVARVLLVCPVTTAASFEGEDAVVAPPLGATVGHGLQAVPFARPSALSTHPRAKEDLFPCIENTMIFIPESHRCPLRPLISTV